MESEIQRRKEHNEIATNFERARGFVRRNWKSKNFDPNDDPTKFDSSPDESEDEKNELEERNDKVYDVHGTSKLGENSVCNTDLVDVTLETDHASYKADSETQMATLLAI